MKASQKQDFLSLWPMKVIRILDKFKSQVKEIVLFCASLMKA